VFQKNKKLWREMFDLKDFYFFKMKNEKKLLNRHIIEFEAVKKKVFLGIEPFGEGGAGGITKKGPLGLHHAYQPPCVSNLVC
jgi:hypothetical protein